MAVEVDNALYLEFKMIDDAIKRMEKEKNRLAALIAESAGDEEELTVKGRKVLAYKRIDNMRSKELQKDHPDLYASFCFEVTKREFQKGAFSRAMPDLYAQYQSRRLTVVADD